jgi:O-antigen/teichoic acid export membrane protein
MNRLWTKPTIGVLRPMKRSLASIRNVAASYIGAFVEGGSFLLLTPFLVRYLGLGELGLWGISVALAEWLLLFDLGLREAILKYVAAHQARDRARDVRLVCDTALFIYSGAALMAVTAGAGLVWFILPLMVGDPEQLPRVQLALVLLVATAALSLPAGLGGTLLEGLSRFDLLNLFRIMHTGLRMALIVLFLQFGFGLVGVAIAELLARLILHVVRWVAVYRLDPELIPRPWLHRQVRQNVLRFSSWNALRQVSVTMVGKLYEPILSLLAGLPAVGVFFVGRRLGTLPAEVVGPMTGVLLPLSSELEVVGRRRTLQQTLVATTRLSLVLALPLGLVLSIGAEPILGNWMGGRTPEAVPVLAIFALVFMLVAVCMPSEVVLLGLGRSRLLALLGLAQGALTIVIGVPLTERLGPPGLALAGLVAVLLFQVGGQIPVAVHLCGIPQFTFWRKAILPPLVAASPMAVGMLLLRSPLAGGGLAGLVTWSGSAVAVYAFLVWLIVLDKKDKRFVVSQFRRLLVAPSKIDDWEDLP